MSIRPGEVAHTDQEMAKEVAQAVHEAEMICQVYERCARSLPEEFAQLMTIRWWEKPEAGTEHVCTDCDEEMA